MIITDSRVRHEKYMKATWLAEQKRSLIKSAIILAVLALGIFWLYSQVGDYEHDSDLFFGAYNSPAGDTAGLIAVGLTLFLSLILAFVCFFGDLAFKMQNKLMCNSNILKRAAEIESKEGLLYSVGASQSNDIAIALYHGDPDGYRHGYETEFLKDYFLVKNGEPAEKVRYDQVYKVFRDKDVYVLRIRHGKYPHDFVYDLKNLEGTTVEEFLAFMEERLPKNIMRYDRKMTKEEIAATKNNPAVHDKFDQTATYWQEQ